MLETFSIQTGLPLMLLTVSPIYSTLILHLDSLQYRLPNRYPPPFLFIPVSEKYTTFCSQPSSCTLWFGVLNHMYCSQNSLYV